MSKNTILVVDDEEAIRQLLFTILESVGHTVLLAEDGPMALDIASREKIDLIVTDFMMPGMDGAELALRLRTQTNAPTLLISGCQDPSKAIKRFTGVAAFLHKPFHMANLLSVVGTLLADRGNVPTEAAHD